MLNNKWKESTLEFVKLLRLDPYLFLVAFQIAIRAAPVGQLVQDKICLNWYNTSDQYCHDLPTTEEVGEDEGHFKTRILKDTALFGTYITYITTIPAILWALLAGAWIDRYWRGRKLLMLMGVVGAIIENLVLIFFIYQWKSSIYWSLLCQIPQIGMGGQVTRIIAFNHYISSTTPLKLMAIRFMFIDIVWAVGYTIGQSLGGYLLVQKPIFKHGEIRNYTICFIIALVVEVLAFLWVWLMIDNRVDRKSQMKLELKIKGTEGTDNKLKSDMSREDRDIHPIRLLIDFENIKSMVRTVIKKRPNRTRMQIIFILLSICIYILNLTGNGATSGQFVQEVYLWSPDWAAYVSSIEQVVTTLSMMTVAPFLIKVIKMRDIQLGLIGFTVIFFKNLIKGTWLKEIASYLSIPIGSIGSLAYVGTKSHMTKIVNRDELGKAVSMMTALDTLAPMIINPIMVLIFTYTLDKYPGTVYQVIALMVLIPIVMCMWIDIYTERPLDKVGATYDDNHNLEIHHKELDHSHFKKNSIYRFGDQIKSPVKLLSIKEIHSAY